MTVYIFRQSDSNYFKIGFTDSNDVEIRLKSLQTGNPHRLIVHRVFEDAPQILELTFHRVLMAFRTNGGTEWFELPEDILNQFIISISGPEELIDNAWIQRHYGEESATGWTNGNNVRSVCGRQQNTTTSGIEDVFSSGQQDFMPAGYKHDLVSIGKEYYQRFKTSWGKTV